MTEGTYPGTERKQEAEVAWDDLAAAMRNLERAFSGPPPAAAESRRLKKLLAQSVTHLAAAMDALERASPASQDVEAALARAERALVESAAGLRELQDDLIPASCRRDAGNRYSYPFLAGSPHDTVS